MGENREFLLAIALSIVVLLAWQVFVGMPQMEQAERQRAAEDSARQAQTQTSQQAPVPQSQAPGAPAPTAPGSQPTPPGATAVPGASREAAVSQSPRLPIETPSLRGSLNLKGGRIDDLHLRHYHETVRPGSP